MAPAMISATQLNDFSLRVMGNPCILINIRCRFQSKRLKGKKKKKKGK